MNEQPFQQVQALFVLYLSCVDPASQSLEYKDQSTGGTGYSPTDPIPEISPSDDPGQSAGICEQELK